MNFSEVREYQLGDETRFIDWNVTARYNNPHVKVFEEEREHVNMFFIDVSGSLDFGGGERTKKRVIVELFATVAFSCSIVSRLPPFPSRATVFIYRLQDPYDQ